MFLVSNSFFDLRARTVWVTQWRSSLERVASGKCFKVKVKSLYCGHSIRKHWFLYLFCSFVPNDCPSLHVTCPSVDVIPVEQWYEKETGSYMKLLTYHVMISEKKTIAVEFNRFILWVFESSSIEEKQTSLLPMSPTLPNTTGEILGELSL